MEALWNLEDKWKLSTKKSIILFACTSFLLLVSCIVIFGLIKYWTKKTRIREMAHNNDNQGPSCKNTYSSTRNNDNPMMYRSHFLVKEVLKGSTRWSGSIKWNDEERGRNNNTIRSQNGNIMQHAEGWESHNSASGVWQRPILMGEKCELPRFSGLILYDQRGAPLNPCFEDLHAQDESCVAERTTLRDLF